MYSFLDEDTATIVELTQQVAEWEQEVETESIAMSLHHQQLPRLADHGMVEIEYGEKEDTVQATAAYEQVQELVAQVSAVEEEGGEASSPREFFDGDEAASGYGEEITAGSNRESGGGR
ncbi:hypothetical protein C481_10167 [Natrialba asiatica DSM 12278]|uniref:DUF7344 domain-containing protein n=2 Tax=Natrialba asiatica TaxID=64602 RepID=M0AV89_NATA1|nr:hypothetical protein C481_10167 [Natrialba asiatica DSM 12278]